MAASESLPPLIKDLEIAPASDGLPEIDTRNGALISFKILENRKPTVKIFITIDSSTGEPIISQEFGVDIGKSFDLDPGGVELPWERTYSVLWDGKLANGEYPPNGEHTLFVHVRDDDGNDSPDETHIFTIETYPVISSTYPVNNSYNVPSSSESIITFDRAMNMPSVESAISISPDFMRSYTWSADKKTVTITPSQSLSSNTDYTVTVSDRAFDANAHYLDGDKDGNPGGNYTFTFSTKKANIQITALIPSYADGSQHWVNAGTKTFIVQLVDTEGEPILASSAPVLNWTSSGGSIQPVIFTDPGTPASSYTSMITVTSTSGEGQAVFTNPNNMPISGIITFMIDTRPPTLEAVAVGSPSCSCPNSAISFQYNAKDSGSGVAAVTQVGLGLSANRCYGPGEYEYGASSLIDKVGNSTSIVGKRLVGSPPGCDHPDDNYSVNGSSVLPTGSEDPFSGVAVLRGGYYEDFSRLMSIVQRKTMPIGMESIAGDLIGTATALVIPSGGLYGMEKSLILKAQLDEFVKQGGTLVVFDQQHGYEFSALPVPREADGSYKTIAGFGWTEDQSCQFKSSYIDTWHQILAGQSDSTPSLNVDGYFTNYPSNATVVLRRTANGQPALIVYPYGLGHVIATTLYSDYAFGYSQATSGERALVRDLISWSQLPIQLPEVQAGNTLSLSLKVTATNNTSTDAASVKIRVLDPNRISVLSEQTMAVMIAAGQFADIPVSLVSAETQLGIYHIDYTLLDAQGKVIKPETEAASGKFAVSNPPSNPYKSPDFNFSIQSDAEQYLNGTPATFTVNAWNNTEVVHTITFNYWMTHLSNDARGTYTIEVPAQSSASFTRTVPEVTLQGGWLRGQFYDEKGKQIGYAEKAIWANSPMANITIETSSPFYMKGENVIVSALLNSRMAVNWESTVKITITDPQNIKVFEDARTTILYPFQPNVVTASFILPITSTIGTYTVRAEVWSGTKLVTATSNSFDLPQSRISVVPNVPAILNPGNNTISFRVFNFGKIDIASGVLDISLKMPDGTLVYSDSLPFSLNVGEVKYLSSPVDIPPLSFGNYVLTYIQSDETKRGVPLVHYINNYADIVASFDKHGYRNGDMATLGAGLINIGRFDLKNVELMVSAPDIDYTATMPVSMLPGDSPLNPFIMLVPSTVTPGTHAVNVSLTLPSGSSLTRSVQMTVPAPILKITYPGPAELKGGDTVAVTIENAGGTDTTISGLLEFSDAQYLLLADTNYTETLPAGESKTISFAVPLQAVDGNYNLYIEALDSRNDKWTWLDKTLTITGVKAGLSVKTGKAMYLDSESIDALSTLMNQAYTVENGTLNLQIVNPCNLNDVPKSSRISSCRQNIVWETDIPITQAANTTIDVNKSAYPLTPAQYYLRGTLSTNAGQVLSQAEFPFTVVSGDFGLRFRTDKALYRAGETITITGEVRNFTAIDAPGMTVTLYGYPGELYSETFDLAAQGSHAITVTIADPEGQGIYQLNGDVSRNSITIASSRGTYEVALPDVSNYVDIPEVIGSEAFPIRVYLYNDGKVPGTVVLKVSGGSLSDSRTIIIPPGSSTMVEYSQTITADTLYTLEVTGDLIDDQQFPVVYGEKATIALGVQAHYPEGRIAVPVTITNTGQLDETLTISYQLGQGTGSPAQETRIYSLSIGASVTDTLVYTLPEGNYQVTATSQKPGSSKQASFSVRKENNLQMTTSIGEQVNGLFPVTTTFTNLGFKPVVGGVRVSVISDQGAEAWYADQPFDMLMPDASRITTLGINPTALAPGDYIVNVALFDASGQHVQKQSTQFSVQRASFQITQLPHYQSFNAGQEGIFVFKVKNTGAQEGSARLKFKAYDLIDTTGSEWLKPGEEKEFTFRFLMPDDVEEKDYFAEYELQDQRSGSKGQVSYHLAGINIGVNALLDRQNYAEGAIARLTLTVSELRTLITERRLFARVNYNGYEEQKPFTLNGSQTLTFDVPLSHITGEKLFYGIYHTGGRSIHLNSVYIHKAGDAITLTTDKQVYDPGETVSFSVKGQGAGVEGTMTVTGVNYNDTFPFSGEATKSVTLPLIMTAGTYNISAQLTQQNAQSISAIHPIDVNGIQVKIIEANLDKGAYAETDTITANLTITSNRDLSGMLKTWVVDPQGNYMPAGEAPVTLSSSRPSLVAHHSSLITASSGIHRLLYTVYSGDMALSSGTEVFDVGNAVLLGVSTDKREYPSGAAPVLMKASIYGSTGAVFEVQLDGATVKTEPVTLNGFVTLNSEIGVVLPGRHVLRGILTTGSLTSSKETNFTITPTDTTPPETKVAIGSPKRETPETVFVSSSTVFTGSATDDQAGIAKTKYRIDGGTWTAYAPFSIAVEGNHTIEFQSQDMAGNLEIAKSLAITVDTTPPTGSLMINAGSLYTNNPSVMLMLSCADLASGCVQMAFSNDAATWSTPEAFTSSKTWLLISGDGPKNVYVKYLDGVGNVSSAYRAGIALDTTAPMTQAMPAGGLYNAIQKATLTTNETSMIYYTIDGTVPTVESSVYQGPITIAATATIKFFAKDTAGNSEEVKSETYTIDNQAPTLTLSTLPDGSYTNNEAMNMAGTIADNVGLQSVTVNDIALTVHADGTFSQVFMLASGTNKITFIAMDLAGNQTTDVRTITLDQTAPMIEIAAPADNSVTNDAAITVTGMVDEFSTVDVQVNKGSRELAPMTGNLFSLPIILVYGQNTIEVASSDRAMNIGTAKRTVIYDNVSPALAVTSPAQDMVTNQSSIVLEGTVADLTPMTVSIAYEGSQYLSPVSSGTFQQTLAFSLEKTYPVLVTATDAAGNTTIVQRNIIFDKTPPAITINPVTTPTNQATHAVGGTMEAGAAVSATCTTATMGLVTYPTATTWQTTLTNMTEGTNTISAIATDQAGNTSMVHTVVDFDPQAPLTTVTPVGGVYQMGLTVTLTTNEAATIYYSLDGAAATPLYATYSGPITLDATTTLRYFAVDSAGNHEAAKNTTYTIVTTPPITIHDVEKKIAVDMVVLVGIGSDDSDREENQANIRGLESLLSSLGMQYTIAQNMDEFTEGLRSGRYTIYVLIDVKEPLVNEEIREAINYGDGLIFIKTKPEADPFLDDVFCAHVTGKTTGKDLTVHITESPIGNEGTIRILGKQVIITETMDTARSFGYVTDKSSAHPAIVFNQYGRGRTILFTFDILSSPDKSQAAALLLGSLNDVRPLEHSVRALDSVPVRIKLGNSTVPAALKVIETIPDKTTVDTPRPWAAQNKDAITWYTSLSLNKSVLLSYYLNLPDVEGNYTAGTEVRYKIGDDYQLYDDYFLTLTIQRDSTGLTQEILSSMNSITPTNTLDAKGIAEALEALTSVDTRSATRKGATRNIRAIIKATDELIKLPSDTSALRLKLDELLKIWEKKWYLMGLPEQERDNKDRDD